jgi:hypothetical protein
MKGSRIIKQENFKGIEITPVKEQSIIMNPLLMHFDINNTKESICMTKFNIDKKSNNFYLKKYNCQVNPNDYKKYMFIPPIGLFSSDLLTIYNVDSIDSLMDFVENNNNIDHINMILNSWMRVNLNNIKNNTTFLAKIYYKLLKDYFTNKDNDPVTIIKEFIDSWVSKKSPEDFYFDLYNDTLTFLFKNK